MEKFAPDFFGTSAPVGHDAALSVALFLTAAGALPLLAIAAVVAVKVGSLMLLPRPPPGIWVRGARIRAAVVGDKRPCQGHGGGAPWPAPPHARRARRAWGTGGAGRVGS